MRKTVLAAVVSVACIGLQGGPRTDDIFAVARTGNAESARTLLDEGPELIKATDRVGDTPLHAAALRGHVPIVFEVRRLSPRTLVLWGGPYRDTNVVIASRKGLILVDSNVSPSLARAIADIVRKELGRGDVEFVINTHADGDHTHGNSAFPRAEIIAHRNTYRDLAIEKREIATVRKGELAEYNAEMARLRDERKTLSPDSEKAAEIDRRLVALDMAVADLSRDFDVRPPTRVFDDHLTLDCGDVTVKLIYFGAAHRTSDVVVVVPEEGLVMTGDLSFDPTLAEQRRRTAATANRMYASIDVPRWLRVLDEVLLPENHVALGIAGHFLPFSTREVLIEQRDYLKTLWAAVGEARASGRSLRQTQTDYALDNRFPRVRKWPYYASIPKVELERGLPAWHNLLIEMFWEDAGKR